MKNKKNSPLVSIIVTNFNGEKYLKKCFGSLYKQKYKNIELIFSDGHSSDNSVKYIKTHYPKVKISRDKENLGLSYSSNNGSKLAKGKYLLFYNNDTISLPDFIGSMVKVAQSDEKIGVVCPLQLSYNPQDDQKRTDDQLDMGVGSDIYGYICTARDAGHIFYPDAAIFIRRSLFDLIGGFDNDFFIYGEDMDLCWRVHLMGYKVAAAPKAIFRHDSFCAITNNGKIQTSYKRRLFVERQVIQKMLKYYQATTLVWLLPKFFFFYFSEALFFLIIKRNPRMFFGVYLKAVWWNVQKLNSTLSKRYYIQSIRVIDDKEIMKLMYPKYRKIEAVRRLGVPEIK